ncbi:YjdF family protein [uncultured Clostridium sp.]|uniref:YjdF family protein n=1 Tax=uncultured Clostridium sp. TaxID=59620 RepID=UPI0025CCD01E|nr:YjdF family protein [uncultured Clostridium sp.]
MVKAKLTVFFENPFWVGVFEVEEGEKYKVSKFTFGSEPKEEQVQLLILRDFYKLDFSKLENVGSLKKESKKINPKRMQREIKKEKANVGVGTKAQIAIKKHHEENKVLRKRRKKEQKEIKKDYIYELKKIKKLQKHKGH